MRFWRFLFYFILCCFLIYCEFEIFLVVVVCVLFCIQNLGMICCILDIYVLMKVYDSYKFFCLEYNIYFFQFFDFYCDCLCDEIVMLVFCVVVICSGLYVDRNNYSILGMFYVIRLLNQVIIKKVVFWVIDYFWCIKELSMIII